MGEAKRRADAHAAGRTWRMDQACPRCASRLIQVSRLRTVEAIPARTLVGFCKSCGCTWEAYPSDWVEDVVAAAPCDNCAFRPGSPESRDRAGWKELLTGLKSGREFKCHKGAPMTIDLATMTAEFDADWIKAHGRTCAGFHRAIMTKPGWMAARYPELAAAMAEMAQEALP